MKVFNKKDNLTNISSISNNLLLMSKETFSKKRLIIILLILIFLIFLMINFSFPDLFSMFYVPSLINQGNVYTQVIENRSICTWLDAIYPPLYYLVFGPYMIAVKALNLIPAGLFTANACPVFDLILNQRFLFWVKLPFLIFHFASAIIFQEIISKQKFFNLLFWLLNPIIIFITFIQGQYEIIPVFFILLALLKFKQEKFGLSFFSIGIGGALKHFPFLFLPAFFLFLPTKKRKDVSSILKLSFLTFFPYVISIIPFIHNSDMLNFMLNFSENTKMLSLTIPLGNQAVSAYLVVLALIIFYAGFFMKKNFVNLIKTCFLISAIYFLSTHWYVQRLLYLMPFLLILAAQIPNLINFLPWFNISYFTYVLFSFPEIFDYTLTRPFFFEKLDAYKRPFSVDAVPLQTIANSLMYAGLLFSIFIIIRNNLNKKAKQKTIINAGQILKQMIGLGLYLAYLFSPFIIKP